MDFRELSYVAAIAEHQNISKAASALYVTQPTLSKFLIALESELGQKLFRRVGNKYVLTYAGERYVEKANQIMQMKADLDKELADIIKRDRGVLNVAIPSTRSAYILPQILPAYEKKHPNVRVNVFDGDSTGNERKVLNGSVEIMFTSMPADPNPLMEYEMIGREEMVICTCKDHPLKRYAKENGVSRYPKLDPALLKTERILLLKPFQRTRQLMDDYLRKNGLTYENCMEISNLQTILELTAVGYGVTFVFDAHLHQRGGRAPLDAYSFGNPIMTADFTAAYRKGSYLPTYARDFIELTKEYFSQ